MRKARFEFSEVALSQVETVYEWIKVLVPKKAYETLKGLVNTANLSAKQYYHLLDELIFVDKLFNDVDFAKILFSSELQHLNSEYRDGFGEPLAQTLMYQANSIGNDLIYELFMDKQSKIIFDEDNVNRDNVIQVLIDTSKHFTDEQFENLFKLFVFDKKIHVYNVNDFGKTPLDLFLYRKRINDNVFDILLEKFYLDEKEQFETTVRTKMFNYLGYSNEEYKNLDDKQQTNFVYDEFDRLFN